MNVFYPLLIALTIGFSGFASELFLRVSATGEYFASAGEQTIYTTSKVFKFYDIDAGMVPVQVMNRFTNQLLYNSSISLQHNERLVAEVDRFGHLKIIQRVRIHSVNWYTTTVVDDVYSNQVHPHHPHGNNGAGQWNNGYENSSNYQDFLVALKKEAMDNNKLTFAKNYAKEANLKAKQIAEIMNQFSFDANKLEFAKYAYDYCVDKKNYFQVKSSFTFSSNYNELVKYIEGK